MDNKVWQNNLSYWDISWMDDTLSLIEYQIGYIRENQNDLSDDTQKLLSEMKLQLHRVITKLDYAKEGI